MTRPTRLSQRDFSSLQKNFRNATLSLLIAGLLPFAVHAQEKIVSERGPVPITGTTEVEHFRVEKDRDPIERDFVQQPPLIPHAIKGYNITQNFNKCMDCHTWSRAKETKATKVSLTHFKTREGTELSNISPRRYFCLQCHVPQFDAKPLVENTYRPAPAMRSQ